MATMDGSSERQGRAIPVRGWKLRFDAPQPGGIPANAREGDILALFQAWDGWAAPDRREGTRYAPAETRAYIGWWKGPRFLVARAELINLGRGGALVAIDRRPPTSQPVWVCLGAPHPMVHVQARALEVSEEEAGVRQVRLAFHTPCPISFFLAAGRLDARPSMPPSPGREPFFQPPGDDHPA